MYFRHKKINSPLVSYRIFKGEDYIDKIPKEVIIHDTIFKKVYGEGIEFGVTGEPTVKLKTYIKNRAIEDIAPEIIKSINEVFIHTQPLKHLKMTCKSVQDIINNKDLCEKQHIQKNSL